MIGRAEELTAVLVIIFGLYWAKKLPERSQAIAAALGIIRRAVRTKLETQVRSGSAAKRRA